MFPWLEEMHPSLEAISFVDDIGLVLSCNNLDEGARELESIARHAVEWGDSNKVEFEISKTEIVVFSKERRVLQESREASLHIGEHKFAINRGATKWLGFWLDPKLSFKTHFEKRLAGAKGALQRIKGLSGSRGGLPMRLMRRVVVAAVNSVALYGAEVWWRGQQDRSKRLQLLPPNFRMGQLYRHEGAYGRLPSVGWLSSDKTHRTLGGRLAQQLAKTVTYDTEHGFSLLEDLGSPETCIDIRVNVPGNATARGNSGKQTEQLTLFTNVKDSTSEGRSFGAGLAWELQGCWKTKTASLGKYLSAIDANLFAISMAAKEAGSILRKTGKQNAEIVTTSQKAVAAVTRSGQWVIPLMKQIADQAKKLRTQGHSLALLLLPVDKATEGTRLAEIAAQRAAQQQPRHMRSASLSYARQCVEPRGRQPPKLNKHISDAKKAAAARYLQLKSGHAVTGVHLMRTNRMEHARCWWCNGRRQSVAHLMFECRKWRREREQMLRALEAKKIDISARRNEQDLLLLFGEAAVEMVLRFIERTAVGKRTETNSTRELDEWDVGLLDREGADVFGSPQQGGGR